MDMHVPLQVAPERVQRREDARQDAFAGRRFFDDAHSRPAGRLQQRAVQPEYLPQRRGHRQRDVLPARLRQPRVLRGDPLVRRLLPHVGQNRLLQLKHTFLRCGQAPFEQQWLA